MNLFFKNIDPLCENIKKVNGRKVQSIKYKRGRPQKYPKSIPKPFPTYPLKIHRPLV